MADIIYTVNQDSPESIEGFEQYSQEDRALVSSFQINNVFDPTKNYSELHILSLSDELVESVYDYAGYKQSAAAQSAGQDGTSALTIDPVEDSKAYGYTDGGIKLLYHFLDDLYSQDKSKVEFYIQDISADRTELSLATLGIPSEELVTITSAIKTKLESQSYFTGFRLNFKDNDLLIATNIDTLDSPAGKVVTVKLYEPLPINYKVKSTLNIVDVVSDSVAYEIDVEYILPPVLAPTLRSPNFNIDITDHSVVPSGYYDYNELFSYPINNSNSQIYSTVKEKSIDISVDYTDFSDFVHFSSAQERLLNFKYKVDLVNSYSASLSTISTATTGIPGISGSRDYYQNLITGVVSNFDHYERYLYYESGSNSWPKSNRTKPYINKLSTTPEAITWYSNEIADAIQYDQTNYNSLAYSIPSYLRDDANNENYLTFVYMVGQHFDNLWLYSKAVTDKYDADNRIGYGISKDLVAEALQNFGVKLYTSNRSIEDLFTTFIGQAYQSGSEKINVYVTGSLTGSNASIQPTSYDDYQREVQKRIYHNLPLLLKSKGTERGLRALINCFGIPGDILDIKLYGGRNINERPFYGDYQNYTSSLDKIRLDNTGSLVSGSTLSNSVSIIKRDNKYTDDLHVIEVGFSPSDNIDNYIISRSLATASLSSFNIDDYIGNPSNLYLNNYSGLEAIATTVLSGSLGASGSYDLRDYVRLIKFYDNTIFKMVKDFIPARAVADTGIIIKPNLLNRSKAKSVILSGSRPEYTGSIDTAFISGRSPNNFRQEGGELTTQYIDYPQTPTGIGITYPHFQQEATYNGEVSGSLLPITKGEMNSANPYKSASYSVHNYPISFVSTSNEVCLLGSGVSIPFFITSSTYLWNPNEFFVFSNSNCVYSASNNTTSPVYTPTTFPRTFGNTTAGGNYTNYTSFYIKATNRDVTAPSPVCTSTIEVMFATCSMYFKPSPLTPTVVVKYSPGLNNTYDLTGWVENTGNIQQLQFTASYSNTVVGIDNPATYRFEQPDTTLVTIIVRDKFMGDLCKISATVYVGVCNLAPKVKNTAAEEDLNGFYYRFSEWYHGTNVSFLDQNDLEISDPLYPGFISKPQTVGLTFTFVQGAGRRYRGLQSYFTSNGVFGPGITQNPQMRYNIYKLFNPTNASEPDHFNRYSLLTVARAIDTSLLPSNWANDQDPTLPGFSDSDFLLATGTPADYGDNSTYYPIVMVSPHRQIPVYDVNGNAGLPLNVDPRTFPRAYVIEAYRQNFTSCMAQVTIYADKTYLGAADGNGNNPYYTGNTPSTVKWILANWDYSQGIQPGNAYPLPTPGYGPWVEVKVRTYGTLPQIPQGIPG